jgi:hypothetical protein
VVLPVEWSVVLKTIVVLIALKTINSLLEMMIIQMNDEQRFSRRKTVQSFYSTCITQMKYGYER